MTGFIVTPNAEVELKKRKNGLYADDGKYSLNRSPFWRTAEKIWNGLCQTDGHTEESDSVLPENIAWSNLYKLSPSSGNPGKKSEDRQNKICLEILKEELNVLEPNHILMMTGWYGWAENFKDCFDKDTFHDTGKRNICRGENKNKDYVEATARINGAKVVILCRPDSGNERLYVNSALEAFRQLK